MSDNLPERVPATTTIKVAGKEMYYKTVRNCHTCQSPHRDFIEQSIMAGMSYPSILASLQDMESGHYDHPSIIGLSHHVTRHHMPLVNTTTRMMMEERAKNKAIDLEGHVGNIIDYQTVNQIVIQRGMARIANGEIQPSMGDTLAAIRMQHSIEQSVGDGLDVETLQETLLLFMEIARDFIPPDQMSNYGRALNNHPILRALLNKQAQDGEVVSEDD